MNGIWRECKQFEDWIEILEKLIFYGKICFQFVFNEKMKIMILNIGKKKHYKPISIFNYKNPCSVG